MSRTHDSRLLAKLQLDARTRTVYQKPSEKGNGRMTVKDLQKSVVDALNGVENQLGTVSAFHGDK